MIGTRICHMPNLPTLLRRALRPGLALNEGPTYTSAASPVLPLTIFGDRMVADTNQCLNRGQLDYYCDFATNRQQRSYTLVGEQHTLLAVSRITRRNFRTFPRLALYRTPGFTVGNNWVRVYISTCHHQPGGREKVNTQRLNTDEAVFRKRIL